MKGYVLYNDELGYTYNCPVFANKEEAEQGMAGKCRRHSVIEVADIAELEPCRPIEKFPMCANCCRFAGAMER